LTGTPTNTPINTPTNTPSATPTGVVQLVGHVTWQGPPAQPNVRQQLPITLTLRLGSSADLNFTGLTTDASGFFTVTLIGQPAGTYAWRAKGPKYLANCGTVPIPYSTFTTIQQEMGTMRAGDVDGTHNNVVNATDFNVLKGVFGQASTVGDLNNDGVTNSTDFNLLKGNFGQAGCNPILGPSAGR
jgi:hypothetical protein